jgi:hypothetical protein
VIIEFIIEIRDLDLMSRWIEQLRTVDAGSFDRE